MRSFQGLFTLGYKWSAKYVCSRKFPRVFFRENTGITPSFFTVFMHFPLGAHMNPAVTLASAVVRRLAWIKVPVYCMAQFLGAFIASAIVYGIYYGRDMCMLCMCMLCGLIFLRRFLRIARPSDNGHASVWLKQLKCIRLLQSPGIRNPIKLILG